MREGATSEAIGTAAPPYLSLATVTGKKGSANRRPIIVPASHRWAYPAAREPMGDAFSAGVAGRSWVAPCARTRVRGVEKLGFALSPHGVVVLRGMMLMRTPGRAPPDVNPYKGSSWVLMFAGRPVAHGMCARCLLSRPARQEVRRVRRGVTGAGASASSLIFAGAPGRGKAMPAANRWPGPRRVAATARDLPLRRYLLRESGSD